MDGVVAQHRRSLSGATRRDEGAGPAHSAARAHRALTQRRYLTAGAVLAATGALAVSPISPVTPAGTASTVARAVKLVADGDSIFNVPLNLIQDLINIPGNEFQAMDQLGESLIFSGDWWTPSAVNIWGEDPGDPGHFMSIIDMLFPFKAISGLGQAEIDQVADANGTAGLGQQISLLADAEIPVSASSDADNSAPILPTVPITGFTTIDKNLWFLGSLFGLQKYPLFDGWFQKSFAELESGDFKFGSVYDPSYGLGKDGSVPGWTAASGYTFVGTHNPAGFADGSTPPTSDNLMPWADLIFKMNLAEPFQNFFQSLEAPVDWSAATSPSQVNGFDVLTLTDVGRDLQTFLTGLLIAFDPWVGGSLGCPEAPCTIPSWLSLTSLVSDINDLWPGNKDIEAWLVGAKEAAAGQTVTGGAYNFATPHQVATDEALSASEQQNFDGGNSGLITGGGTEITTPAGVDTSISFPISPFFQGLIAFMDDLGVPKFASEVASLFGYSPTDYPIEPVGTETTLGPLSTDAGVSGSADADAGSGFWADLGTDLHMMGL